MKRRFSKHRVRIAIALYVLMWLVTVLVGRPSIDQTFDEEFAMGSLGFGGPESLEIPVQRIDFFDASDPMNLSATVPDTPWRCRSKGIAVAPFVIIDEAAWHDHALSGFAGRRAVFWFFGFSKWVPIKIHWVS